MLTDIFAYRYLTSNIWQTFSEVEKRLLNQLFGVVRDVLPYYDSNGKVIETNKVKWKSLHDRLSRELGVDELSSRYYSLTNKKHLGQSVPVSGFFSWDYACERFVKSEFSPELNNPDRFIKERISFIELAMRMRYEDLGVINANLPKALVEAKMRDSKSLRKIHPMNNTADRLKAWNQTLNDTYSFQVEEINERFRRVNASLTLHNGFIQVSTDELIEKSIAEPFWNIVSDPLWQNVDIDIKEALDRRDSNHKDPRSGSFPNSV